MRSLEGVEERGESTKSLWCSQHGGPSIKILDHTNCLLYDGEYNQVEKRAVKLYSVCVCV